MMFEYWPWWLGGLALAGLTILFRLSTNKSLGVSGSWYRVAYWRQQQKQDKAAKALTQNQGAATDALMAAALEEFGDEAVEEALDNSADKAAIDKISSNHIVATPWTVHLVFLLCTFGGAFLWAMYTGNFQIQFELSELHTQLSGQGWKMFFVLFVGGLFVGIGTQMAGGCSSGHGLSGCANFSLASVIATVFFFGTAVLVSMSLQAFLP